MTLKEYIRELSTKISNQWLEQSHLKSRLRSRLDALENDVASGKKGLEEEIKQLEFQIDVLEMSQPKLSKTRKFVYSCSERVDNEVKQVGNVKLKGSRGNNISEKSYKMADDMEFVQRETTIDGRKYSFIKTRIGDEGLNNNPSAYLKEGFENGERTYYESWSNGGPREVVHKELAYDTITYAPENGIPVRTKKRNPAKDATFKELYDYENGTTITIERPVVDKNGNIIGSYNFSEQQNTHKHDWEYFKKKIVIESKCKDKDGNEIVLKSVIMDNGRGIMQRDDLINGKPVTKIIMNRNENFVTVKNYKDGKDESWARYEDYDGTWELTKQKYYDEIGNEKDEEDMTGNESYNPEKLELYEAKDLMYSQNAFLGGVDIPLEIQNLLNNESFDEKATGRDGFSSVEYELDDHNIRELKEKQQKREQKQSKDNKQQQDWD